MKIGYRVLLMVFLFPLVLFAAEESQQNVPQVTPEVKSQQNVPQVTPEVKSQQNVPQVTPEALAIASTEQWLKVIDADNYDKGWMYAAESLKNAVPKDSFKQTLQKVRSPLGSMKKRVFAASQYTTPPDGEYVVMKYKTEFANKADAVETLISKKEDGQWKVYGYYIK
jgi:predicted oxidoreductase (fatty acid repression mutant protein)